LQRLRMGGYEYQRAVSGLDMLFGQQAFADTQPRVDAPPRFFDRTQSDHQACQGSAETLAHRTDSRNETIAARLGHQDLGARGVALDLLSEAVHMGLQRVGGHRGIVAPYLSEKCIAPDRPIARPIEVF
jgi:hypothetical protein